MTFYSVDYFQKRAKEMEDVLKSDSYNEFVFHLLISSKSKKTRIA